MFIQKAFVALVGVAAAVHAFPNGADKAERGVEQYGPGMALLNTT